MADATWLEPGRRARDAIVKVLAMNLAASSTELINWPEPAALAGGLGSRRHLAGDRRSDLAAGQNAMVARGLGIVGLVMIVVVLFLVPQQTIHREAGSTSADHPAPIFRASRAGRWPGCGRARGRAAVMMSVCLSTQRRLRSVPRVY